MNMISEKLKGHKPIIAAAPERGNVINLMDALKASLSQAKPPAKSKSKAEPRPRSRLPRRSPRRRCRQAVPPRGKNVTAVAGKTFGIIGRARRIPAAAGGAGGRAAARAASGAASRAAPRMLVFGRTLLDKAGEAEIEARFDAERKAGRDARSARTASCACSAW